MKTKIDVLVIGSGIIGSWIAYYSALKGLSVALCEKESQGGDGITGRNSGVLHSGIYYPKNSEKLKHCLRGYELSLPFFEKNNVAYLICGKLITIGKTLNQANQKEKEENLFQLLENGKQNGIPNLEIISKPYVKYNYVVGELALHIPKTGIVDVVAYLKTLWRLCENEGVIFLYNRKFHFHSGEILLESSQGSETVEADWVINAGGLYSDEILKSYGITDYEIRPNKGEYYFLKKSLPYQKLIYPLPHKTSTALGVHYTFNLANEAYAGPNSNWAQNKTDYEFQTPKEKYYESLLNILSYYKLDELSEGYVGLRPRLFFKDQPYTDFLILEFPKKTIHLLGIESPGLTSAPSIGLEIVEKYLC